MENQEQALITMFDFGHWYERIKDFVLFATLRENVLK
jgi:hypothetical protein